MWPIGTYERFLRKIKGQEGKNKVDYFGVLFCDIRQTKAKEYILNYLEIFDDNSSKYIDFYIPGYILQEGKEKNSENVITVKGKNYIYCQKEYFDFCKRFEQDFNVEFPFSATLVLMEYISGNFSTARKMVFELEGTDKGVRSAGEFFNEIFKCAKSNEIGKKIDDVSKNLASKQMKGLLAAGGKTILNFFGIDLEPIVDQYDEIKKYKIM